LFRGDDGVLQGAVVDFIDFQWFPIFNIADMAINVGAGLLILSSILGARAARDVEPELEPARVDDGGDSA
jgi:signal peptidase II